MTLYRSLFVAAVIGLLAWPASAQEQEGRVEASAALGYTFSEGLNVNSTPVGGLLYNRVDPAGGASFNLSVGGYVTEQAEIEFQFNHQSSTLEITGTGPQLNGDMSIFNYHGNFVYNFGYADTIARPFLFAGLGATSYGDATFPARTVPGATKFSWVLGGGVKAFASPHVGVKAMVQWVPTYIRSDTVGWWCDPFYGCGAAGNPKYSHQFEISGGIVGRF